MTTRSDLRAELRIMLEDSAGAQHLWLDAELDVALRIGMRTFGARRPIELSTVLAVTSGTTSYTLPPAILDSRDIVRLLDQSGRDIPRDDQPRGDAGSSLSRAFRTWGNQLIVEPPPAETGSWSILHRSPRNLIEDDVTAQPVAADDEPVLIQYACAAALKARSIAEAKRGADRNAASLRALADNITADADNATRSRQVRSGVLS